MADAELRHLLLSLRILSEWLVSSPEREREWCNRHDDDPDKPFIIELTASRRESVRGHSLPDVLAQAAQVVLLNPELE